LFAAKMVIQICCVEDIVYAPSKGLNVFVSWRKINCAGFTAEIRVCVRSRSTLFYLLWQNLILN